MPYVSDIRAYAKLTRPQNASGSILTFCIGYFLVISKLSPDFFVGLIILLVLHSYATVQNDVADFDIDKANKRESVLQSNTLSLMRARLFVRALAFLAVLFALVSPHRKLHLAVILGLLIVSWLYNLNPVRVSKKPVASIVLMGLCYGAFPFAYGYLIGGGNLLSGYFVILAFFWLLARISTAIMKDYKDAPGDALFNKRTFYLHYGANMTAWVSIVTCIVAYLGLLAVLVILRSDSAIFYSVLGITGLLAVRSVISRLKLLKTTNEKRLNVIFHESVLGHNQFEVAVLACLILSSM